MRGRGDHLRGGPGKVVDEREGRIFHSTPLSSAMQRVRQGDGSLLTVIHGCARQHLMRELLDAFYHTRCWNNEWATGGERQQRVEPDPVSAARFTWHQWLDVFICRCSKALRCLCMNRCRRADQRSWYEASTRGHHRLSMHECVCTACVWGFMRRCVRCECVCVYSIYILLSHIYKW